VCHRTCPARARHAALGLALLLLAVALPAVAQGPAKKPAPPEAAEQEKALALLRSVFRADFDKARADAASRRALAATLLDEGTRTKDDAALRFVALRQAYNLAVEASDFTTALRAVDELTRGHAVDALGLKAAVLFRAVRAPLDRDSSRTLGQSALELITEALAADDYTSARRLTLAALSLGRGARQGSLAARAEARRGQIERLAKEFARIRWSLEALGRDPDNPAANLAAGRFRCLVQDRWGEGLALLARCGDPAWKALAREELAEPDTAARQAALGDAWWARASAETGDARLPLLRRAYHWYRRALPDLNGAERERVRGRVEVVVEEVPYLLVGEVRRLQGPAAPVAAVAFSPDGRFVYSVGGDAFIHKAEVRTGKEVARFEGHTEEVWAVAVSRDGRRVLSGGKDGTLRLWDADSGKGLRRLDGHTDAVRGVAFSPDGRYAVSGGECRTVRLWDLTTGRELRRWEGHTRSVEGVAFSPDGTRVISASWDRTLRLWDVGGDRELRRFTGHTTGVYRVAFSPNGKNVLSGSGDGTLRLWDVASGREVRAFEGHTGHVIGVAFSPDGARVLSGGGDGDNSVRLWDTETGSELHRFTGHKGGVWGVAFSPDGRRAVSCGEGGSVRLWGLPE
jgi:hypothetical protein